jgi:hypothetical protein
VETVELAIAAILPGRVSALLTALTGLPSNAAPRVLIEGRSG